MDRRRKIVGITHRWPSELARINIVEQCEFASSDAFNEIHYLIEKKMVEHYPRECLLESQEIRMIRDQKILLTRISDLRS